LEGVLDGCDDGFIISLPPNGAIITSLGKVFRDKRAEIGRLSLTGDYAF